MYLFDPHRFHQPPLIDTLVSIAHERLHAHKQPVFVSLCLDLLKGLVACHLTPQSVSAPCLEDLFFLQAFLKPLILHLVSPLGQIRVQHILLVLPHSNFLYQPNVFGFLSLQVQIDHDLPFLQQLFAKPYNPEPLLEPLCLRILAVPHLEQPLLDELALKSLERGLLLRLNLVEEEAAEGLNNQMVPVTVPERTSMVVVFVFSLQEG